MATNLEQWNPNIKSPGIEQNPGGAYRNPDFVSPDWKSINEGWQKMQDSITSGHSGFMKAKEMQAKKAEEDDKKRQDLNAGFEKTDIATIQGIDANQQKALTDWMENKIATDGNYADQTEKVKAEWMKEAKELGLTRNALQTLSKEWNENNDIDYSKLGLNPEMATFLNSMFTDKNSMGKIETKDGVLGIYYTVGGQGPTTATGTGRDPFTGKVRGKVSLKEQQFMPLASIQAAVTTYTDAGEEKTEMLKGIKEYVDGYKKEVDAVATGTGIYKDYNEEQRKAKYAALYKSLQDHLSGDGYSKRDKAFIFNNFFGEKNRYTRFDPETMNESFNKGFENFVNEKFGITSPMFKPDPIDDGGDDDDTTPGKVNLGGSFGEVDKPLYGRVKTLFEDLFAPLSEHPEKGYDEVGASSSDEDAEYIEQNKGGKTQALYNALEVGRDKVTVFGWDWETLQEHLDVVLKKSAANQDLTDAEKGVLKEYKEYKGSFDENVDISSSMPDKYVAANFNRKDQKITFKDKSDKEITKDLTLQSHRSWVMQQMMRSSGGGSDKTDTEVDNILKYLLKNSGTKFEVYKPTLD